MGLKFTCESRTVATHLVKIVVLDERVAGVPIHEDDVSVHLSECAAIDHSTLSAIDKDRSNATETPVTSTRHAMSICSKGEREDPPPRDKAFMGCSRNSTRSREIQCGRPFEF